MLPLAILFFALAVVAFLKADEPAELFVAAFFVLTGVFMTIARREAPHEVLWF